MMVHVFVGPTLAQREVHSILPEAVVSGPAQFGDVYRAARRGAGVIALIDGYFERVPATWHKEVLWAMSEGVRVFGASSMGALRAAELCELGMIGVGKVFEAFRDGRLEDDDEVAVAHADESRGFAPASEAMVNVRATFERAVRDAIVSEATAAELARIAKSMFYAERTYAGVLEAGAAAGLETVELASLRRWLGIGRVDQKRADAQLLLQELKSFLTAPAPASRAQLVFEPTDAWQAAERVASAGLAEETTGAVADDLLEELKLSGDYADVAARAAAFGWSVDAARRAGVRPDAQAVRGAVETFRRDAGLTERQAFERWRSSEQVDERTLTRFFEDRARANWAEPLRDMLALRELPSQLRASGDYGRLRERSLLKAQRLQAAGLASPSLADVGLNEQELWSWYFSDVRARQVPADLDVFARASGFSGVEELRRAALREYCFRVRLAVADAP